MGNLYVFDHPMIQHKLSVIRRTNTAFKEFRELVEEVSMLMAYEVTRDLPLREVEIQTPITRMTAHEVDAKIALVPILRAGLGMVSGMQKLLPHSVVGHIGLYRDPETLQPKEYYCKLPPDIAEREAIVLDPMLATGGSASAAIAFLKKHTGGNRIKLMSLIAAPEGVRCVSCEHPEVDIFVAAVDEGLNDHGYIVPGLGDAGDRLFGTK